MADDDRDASKPGTGDKPGPAEATGATSKVRKESKECKEPKKDVLKDTKPRSASSSDLSGEAGADSVVLKVLSGLETAFTNSFRQVMQESSRSRGSERESDASRTQGMQRKAVQDVLRSNMRALNVKAPDMTLELAQFFKLLEAYFSAMGPDPSGREDLHKVTLLETVMGPDCTRAMLGLPAEDRSTYVRFKKAIEDRFAVKYDPVHSLRLLRQCTMRPDESTKDFVTRLWAYASRLRNLNQEWLQNLVLASLSMGHTSDKVRDLLAKERPPTVQDAERLCEELDERERAKPVTQKFVSAMNSVSLDSGEPAAVDNVRTRGFSRGRSRGFSRGSFNDRGPRRDRRERNDSDLVCYRCRKPGHTSRVCRAACPVSMDDNRSTQGRGQQAAPQRGGSLGRSVGNVNTHSSPYSGHADNTEQARFDAWSPVPLSDLAPQDAVDAYSYAAFDYAQQNAVDVVHQDELTTVPHPSTVSDQDTLPRDLPRCFGTGSPHRVSIDSTSAEVRNFRKEWWTQVTIGRAGYYMKVDTGARVNVISLADLSRLGYSLADLQPSRLWLVGFNTNIVHPLGALSAVLCVNGVSITTVFHVVEKCSNPLLCLTDAERLGLVQLDTSCAPPPRLAPVAEFNAYKYEAISLQLKDNAVPRQFPCRKIPLALQPRVREELAMMVRDGIVYPVTDPSPWCHPLQIAYKPDGRLRLCMDPRYLNQYLERAIFPFPSMDEVFSSVQGSCYFSKIDLTWGFWNLKLDLASQHLCTFITPWGVYRYARLPFGVSPAPEVFHRVIGDVIRDIPGTIHFIDDILVHAPTLADHDARLHLVLTRLRTAGFAVSDTKCVIRQASVVFLGHKISGSAIEPDPAKVSALRAMLPPTNASELRGFMGFANFLAPYVPQFSTLTEPLRRLQSGKVLFRWTADQQQAFECLKEYFSTGPCLVPFDDTLPVTLATDASTSGLGGVLLQNNRPVLYVARSLAPAEHRYSTIELELLAMAFALRRTHFYTFGRPVHILTDHNSLLGLVKSDLDTMTVRLRRFLERLLPYDLTWSYLPGKDNVIPDYLSRKVRIPPTGVDIAEAEIFACADERLARLLLGGGLFYQRVAEVGLRDPLFTYLRDCILSEWPRRCPAHVPGLSGYWPSRYKLRVCGSFILTQDDRVCVPVALYPDALALLHTGHPGIQGMCAKGRRVLYWPGWSRDVQHFVLSCAPCSQAVQSHPREPLFFDLPPEFPGDQVAADHFLYHGKTYLVMVDAFSSFPFLFPCSGAGTAPLLLAAQTVFLQTGLPRVFVSDGGKAFVSTEFQAFLASCSVRHRKSTAEYAQSNGLAERAVRTLKTLRAKCSSPMALFHAILELQNTPRGDCRLSPAEIFLGRRQRTTTSPCPRSVHCDWSYHHALLRSRQTLAQHQHGFQRPLRTAYLPGTRLLLRDFFSKPVFVTVLGFGHAPRAYRVELPSGAITERNHRFLFPLDRTLPVRPPLQPRHAIRQVFGSTPPPSPPPAVLSSTSRPSADRPHPGTLASATTTPIFPQARGLCSTTPPSSTGDTMPSSTPPASRSTSAPDLTMTSQSRVTAPVTSLPSPMSPVSPPSTAASPPGSFVERENANGIAVSAKRSVTLSLRAREALQSGQWNPLPFYRSRLNSTVPPNLAPPVSPTPRTPLPPRRPPPPSTDPP